MQASTDYCLLISTCGDADTADKIARQLVAQRLAACVNIINSVHSVYQWQGQLKSDAECILFIKTKNALLQELSRELRRLHPYELPEIITVPIESLSQPYLNWLADNVKTP